MTYSNRSYSSPYQHQTEFGKTNNSVVIDKINPFAWGKMSLPGTWSDPYAHAKYPRPITEPVAHLPSQLPQVLTGDQQIVEESPICSWGATYGDNTVALCNPPFNFPPKKSCPMARPIYPERNIDPGMWVYNRKDTIKQAIPSHVLKLIFFIFLLMIIMKLASRKK